MHYKNIDITIVDKQMPTTDGIQIIHKIQSINPNGLAVLLCSNTENTEKLRLPTNTKSVQKPVSIEKLSDSICYLLNNKKS
jgi:two-component SAPR family response regulator